MILVTVGSELPFDRLVRTVDAWAGATARQDIFAQIGHTDWRPKHMPFTQFLEPEEFSQQLAGASIVIGHAGMGTILSALLAEKPILVMPRKASLREVRNEHQTATALRLSEMGRISMAADEVELRSKLERIDQLRPREKILSYANPELIATLRSFIGIE